MSTRKSTNYLDTLITSIDNYLHARGITNNIVKATLVFATAWIFSLYLSMLTFHALSFIAIQAAELSALIMYISSTLIFVASFACYVAIQYVPFILTYIALGILSLAARIIPLTILSAVPLNYFKTHLSEIKGKIIDNVKHFVEAVKRKLPEKSSSILGVFLISLSGFMLVFAAAYIGKTIASLLITDISRYWIIRDSFVAVVRSIIGLPNYDEVHIMGERSLLYQTNYYNRVPVSIEIIANLISIALPSKVAYEFYSACNKKAYELLKDAFAKPQEEASSSPEANVESAQCSP